MSENEEASKCCKICKKISHGINNPPFKGICADCTVAAMLICEDQSCTLLERHISNKIDKRICKLNKEFIEIIESSRRNTFYTQLVLTIFLLAVIFFFR